MTAIEELTSLLTNASADEQAVVLRRARKVMGKGRHEYGPMHLSNDGRDLTNEFLEELEDASTYIDMLLVKFERLRGLSKNTVASFDVSDVTGEVLEVLK